jgi:hypothetical protein
MVVDCGCDVMAGGVQEELEMVTVAVRLFTDPHPFDTRTQYENVDVPPTLIDVPVAPGIGDAVLPLVP